MPINTTIRDVDDPRRSHEVGDIYDLGADLVTRGPRSRFLRDQVLHAHLVDQRRAA